jgi:hypothetical protein
MNGVVSAANAALTRAAEATTTLRPDRYERALVSIRL